MTETLEGWIKGRPLAPNVREEKARVVWRPRKIGKRSTDSRLSVLDVEQKARVVAFVS